MMNNINTCQLYYYLLHRYEYRAFSFLRRYSLPSIDESCTGGNV
jgi:hypothetical protein